MAITATTRTLVDGTKHRVIHVAIATDGTAAQLTDEVVYDYSADTQRPSDTTAGGNKIKKVLFMNGSSGVVNIEFDGATDALAVVCPAGIAEDVEFGEVGGLTNNATTPTGDITLTTLGVAANETISLLICMDKS